MLHSFVRKEAVLSSQMEGTQSSLADLMLFEIDEQPGVPLEDAREVSRCVAAMAHGVERLRSGFPLSLRLLREMHGVLLDHPRGQGKTPGEFRRSQVWLGGTRPGNAVFVPPPAKRLMECLNAFERFLHDEPEHTSPLLRAALAHVQFETIHPFLDGNGRIGRSLIVLQLVADGLLREPLLHPSLFFKAHRARIGSLGRAAASAWALHEALQRQPVATAAALGAATGLTPATVNKTLAHLQRLGLVGELTERQRGRVFAYLDYVALLNAELNADPSAAAPH